MKVSSVILVLIGMTPWLDKILGDDDISYDDFNPSVSNFSNLNNIYSKIYSHSFVRLLENDKSHIAQMVILISFIVIHLFLF